MCIYVGVFLLLLFFFNDTATTEIYTLSLHDALPIFRIVRQVIVDHVGNSRQVDTPCCHRSEERFSRNAETDLVCRLLLEKKRTTTSPGAGPPSPPTAPAPGRRRARRAPTAGPARPIGVGAVCPAAAKGDLYIFFF